MKTYGIIASRGRKKYEAKKVKARRCDMKHTTLREDGLSNTITTVTKDNLILVL